MTMERPSERAAFLVWGSCDGVALSAIEELLLEFIEMRIFKSKKFARFAEEEDISDAMLLAAVGRAQRGLIDADLGGGVIKQRIPRQGSGRSGGYRVILAFRTEHRTFFLHGYAKNSMDNISAHEVRTFRKAAKILLELSDAVLEQQLDGGSFIEVETHE